MSVLTGRKQKGAAMDRRGQRGRVRVATRTWFAGVLVAAAACGAGAPGAADMDELSGPAPAPREIQEAMIECMRAAGLSDYGSDRLDAAAQRAMVEDPGFPEAYDRCEQDSGLREFVPEPPEGFEPADQAQQDRQVLAFVDCLRARGWEVETRRERGHLLSTVPDLRGDEQWAAFELDRRACAREAEIPAHTDVEGFAGDEIPSEAPVTGHD